jgi:hypothetical protein
MAARIFFGALLLVALSFPGWSADSTFRHPAGFSILVPDGWTTDSQKSGVNVVKSSASVGVMVVEGSGSARGLLEAIVSSMAGQWKNWQESKRGNCKVAGLDGACGWYVGVNPKGSEQSIKIAAAGKDGKGYVLFVSGPHENFAAFTRDLDRIENSFSLDGGDVQIPSATKQQLAALDNAYQAGALTTEEYEAKRNALLKGGVAPPAPSGAITPVTPSPRAPALATPRQRVFNSDEGVSFRARDGSFSARVPRGWRNVPVPPAFAGAYFFAPEDGGDERIFVVSGPSIVTSIRRAAIEAATTIGALFPGLILTGQPRYTEQNGLPAAEMLFRGTLANGVSVDSWYGIMLAGDRYFSVLSIASPATARRVGDDARLLFQNLQPF